MLNKEKTTSNSDLSLVDEEQLFSELTSEEAAVIEGGLTLILHSIQAVKAGADRRGRDEAYLLVNNVKWWGVKKMKTGQSRSINEIIPFGGSANIQLFDRDPGTDDFMGDLRISQPTGLSITTLSGSGSIYKLTYEVV
ncbi:MAG: hypothetical protein F6J98_47215 [Moorea sp. SIO4G2]|uniref:hypothetical protein n=1 Tax=unclassified Moorena TaxID=2683338 RepID=UPI0013F83881|nr:MULTISPECIES: hypothetical protein [unclassified Moorena]NEO16560.1 hypothetical protein [Moorena sp. SIO3E8]NEO67539.1 hypothetical protein [Moorena sp. SIO4G2]NEQ03090.1 hypothetical protein [Moorena sp. SIO3F7]